MYEGIRKIPQEKNLYADLHGTIYEFNDGQMHPCQLTINSNNYYYLDKEVYGQFKSVHRLVASAFHGDVRGFEVDHINRIRTDNRPDNLQILTKAAHLRKTRCGGEERSPITYQMKMKLIDRTEILICLRWYSPEHIARILCLSPICVRSVLLQYRELGRAKWRKIYNKHTKECLKNKKRIKSLLKELKNTVEK